MNEIQRRTFLKGLVLGGSAILITACSDGSSNSPGTTTPSGGGGATGGQKVGMIWYGNTDPMGGTFYAWANHAAEILNVELVWALGAIETASELRDCENLINAGCQGVYFIPMDTAANLQLGQTCQNAGVYWATSNRDIADEDVLAACEANPYFVTRIIDDSYDVCKELTKTLADAGVTKVGLILGDPTDGMMVDRARGFKDGCAEQNIEILGEFQAAADTPAVVNGVTNFLTLYPDMEGILSVSGTAGTGEAIISTLEGSGRPKGSIKLATFDTFDGNQQAFEDGWLAAVCGGYTSECLVAFLALVNRLQGNIVSDKVFLLSLSPILITSAAEMEVFSEYVDNPDIQLYSDDTIRSLVAPGLTPEDYQKVLDEWSIEFVEESAGVA
jgi:ABC-type sugar transport system substrate-binding protein